MGFIQAVKHCFANYANFKGRASRSEFWYWALFLFIAGFCSAIADDILGTMDLFYIILSVAMSLPTLAVSVRRLHDLDKSGWWYFIFIIPIIGVTIGAAIAVMISAIILVIWFISKGTEGENRFG